LLRPVTRPFLNRHEVAFTAQRFHSGEFSHVVWPADIHDRGARDVSRNNGAIRDMRLLLIEPQPGDLNRLRGALMVAGAERLHVDCISSTSQSLQSSPTLPYDLVLAGASSEDNHATLLVKQAAPCTPVIFLQSEENDSTIRSILQSALCNNNCGCEASSNCMAMAVFNAIYNYRTEQQQQTSEEMLRKLRRTVEQSPDPVMITDRSGVLEYVNPAFEALTGYSKDEVIGETLGLLKSEQHAGELYEEMWDTVLSGRPFHGIVMNRKKSGETFILEKSITPLRNATGQITHFISTGRDITDQRRLESQLQQAQRMDAIGRLAGGVAHDFNNLLMVISAYAELTLDALPEHDVTREKVGEIVKASRRAADLTRQLLAFGRKQMQSLQLLDLNSVLRDIGKMLPRLIGEDIQIVIAPSRNLDRVEADPVQIEQIVLNLAANARDAMPGGGKLTIETKNVDVNECSRQRPSKMPAGKYVLLSVTDSGMGIPQEHLPHIFEPFYTTKDEGKGTGLGLATVYGIVKQNSGFIWVNSERGHGTSFKIYLPKAQTSKVHDAATSEVQESPRGSETLLLVEDEVALRESSCEFFVRRGYTVLAASNGEEALRVSREYCGPIDLMISDVVMPQMSGPNLAARLAAERPLMKVLFVSGYAENTILRHGKIEASACLLQKPFGLNSLARKVREVLGPKQAQKAASRSAGLAASS